MNVEIKDDIIQVVVLDISGVYAQIHNQGYFDKSIIDDIIKQYSDKRHWRVIVIEK